MANLDHIILCGNAKAPRDSTLKHLVRLDLGGDDPNAFLEIEDISSRLSTNVPAFLIDLIEIASYVYCADQAVTRGGEGVSQFGADWRRTFRFHIPVREPAIWTSKEVLGVLQRTLSTLTEDNYEFVFSQLRKAAPMQQYLTLGDSSPDMQQIDRVILFSGGIDSLGGAVQDAVLGKRKVALVSHRSNPKVYSRQSELLTGLKEICTKPPLHVPVWVHRIGSDGREYTQRSRTFLYASLAAAVAYLYGIDHIQFYENGVVGLNLPISEQVVGTRATRTTHPQVLSGFARLFSVVMNKPFAVENSFLWLTKTEVVDLIGDAGCAHLVEKSVSCIHTHEQTKDQPHCGRCSQCISRRFATLASRYPQSDPGSLYRADLLTAPRFKGKHPKAGDLTLVESFIRTATDIGSMTDFEVLRHYGEIGRILRHVSPLTADQVAKRVIHLYRRHSSDVTSVMDSALSAHASDIREGKLKQNCAILLAISDMYRKAPKDEDGAAPEGSSSSPPGGNGTDQDQTVQIPRWLADVESTSKARQGPLRKGSRDRVELSDPVWIVTADQKTPIPLTRLDGTIVWINPGDSNQDAEAHQKEDEQRIAEVTANERSQLRSALEELFSGTDWPPANAVLEPLRLYATHVFDVNAATLVSTSSSEPSDAAEVLNAMQRNLLADIFGREWESSPGENVVRIDWQHGSEGWKGKEIVTTAGNDPDPNCLYYQIVGDAIKYRYRFHAGLPPLSTGEPPCLNFSNDEWWHYIGLNERHNLAMAMRPYLEDRVAHWHSISKSTSVAKADDPGGAVERDGPTDGAEERPSKSKKGDVSLLGGKLLVSMATAEKYLGVGQRQRQKLIKSGDLTVEGKGQNRKITTKSLQSYLPPEIPN
ncbi:MAG: 7-cyano-7-deazaguanine synthase [Bryobacteraceae bacterium]